MSHRCTKKITLMSLSRQATAPQKSKKRKKNIYGDYRSKLFNTIKKRNIP